MVWEPWSHSFSHLHILHRSQVLEHVAFISRLKLYSIYSDDISWCYSKNFCCDWVTDSSARDLNDQLKLRNAKGKKGYKGGERSESRNIRIFFELAGSETGKRWRHDRPPKGIYNTFNTLIFHRMYFLLQAINWRSIRNTSGGEMRDMPSSSYGDWRQWQAWQEKWKRCEFLFLSIFVFLFWILKPLPLGL